MGNANDGDAQASPIFLRVDVEQAAHMHGALADSLYGCARRVTIFSHARLV
jgi:hypothetical protein